MPLALVPILLLVVPILEIAAFILVGREIGLLPTLGIVVVSAVVGALLLRRQGLGALRRIQGEIAAGRVPGRELADGVLIVAAGILLLTPGLVTDVVGYLLFVPAVRAFIRRFLARRVVVTATMAGSRPGGSGDGGGGKRPARPDVVDLSEEDYERRPDPNSPWNGSHEGNRTLH
ncbi:FxsA family protein [Aureimonas leprariae]|uniref:Membrane protein FxsA n=1 Tax=Plantimonas leprariae TaxID=2615207 RepID=A0A7V7PNK1_9HYPH|nr:FxsA family protein [Aureimonas leprariae]KAB0679337.1 membrane protein FxsA [Aureimonas leprariae]